MEEDYKDRICSLLCVVAWQGYKGYLIKGKFLLFVLSSSNRGRLLGIIDLMYGLQCLDAYSYGATRVDDTLPLKEKDLESFTLPCYINNVCFDNVLADLGASVSVMPLSTYLNLGLGELAHAKLTVELADMTMTYPKGIAENVLVGIGKFVFPVDFIILDMPEDVKVRLLLGKPFLSTTHAKIDVFKRKITLRVGDEKIIFKSMKPASILIKRVYVLSLRECIKLDLEARLIGETLVLNRSLDPLYGDYIELNDLNVPLELMRDQVDDLMPTIKEGEVIEEPMIDIIKTRNNESFCEYPSFCYFDRKIHIDYAYNLRFSCMIVVENMDGYRDQDMRDVIFREPFYKASCMEARRFDGLITIHNERASEGFWNLGEDDNDMCGIIFKKHMYGRRSEWIGSAFNARVESGGRVALNA
nr:hypothetical protein [Tanacetum cinerariifolium]